MVPILKIEGLCAAPQALSWAALDALCQGDARVEHTERLSPKVRGEGVRLDAVLALTRPAPSVTHVLVQDDGRYRACLRLDREAAGAVLAHRSDGAPLPDEAGGPVRLLVPRSGNACLSVKRVTRIVLLDHEVLDTVPR